MEGSADAWFIFQGIRVEGGHDLETAKLTRQSDRQHGVGFTPRFYFLHSVEENIPVRDGVTGQGTRYPLGITIRIPDFWLVRRDTLPTTG